MGTSEELPAGASDDLTGLIKGQSSVEIYECDKTGNIREKWLHTKDDRIISVWLHPTHLPRSPG